MNIVFFGTPEYAVTVLEELKAANMLPTLIVTQPDKPVGRKQVMTPPAAKLWAEENDIEVIQPSTLKQGVDDEADILYNSEWDLFVVAAYGLLLPKILIEKPTHKTLNIHPSLLPKYRGATPVPAQILHDDRNAGVTIMQLDEKMDHGPIITQASITIEEEDWPIRSEVLLGLLWEEGAKLLVETIGPWTKGELTTQEQDHDQATFSEKFTKADGELDIDDGDPYQNYLKYCAFGEWPGTFFYVKKRGLNHPEGAVARVKIKEAFYEDGVFVPTRVIPEGKKEIDYEEFIR